MENYYLRIRSEASPKALAIQLEKNGSFRKIDLHDYEISMNNAFDDSYDDKVEPTV